MAPVVGTISSSRTIVIEPSKVALLNANENNSMIENMELPKYAVGLFESNGPGPRKRKRLTHLTPEEKIMRRKLKNRVAAQTARDRKKARLETLEETVAKIHEQTKKLLDVNSLLLERTESLEKENEILRKRLGLNGDCTFTENKRKELIEIQEDFNNTILEQNLSSSVKNESSDEEYCVLTPYEPQNGSEVCSDPGQCQASKCGSPVPAAFGERIYEGPFPRQQEAVNSVKLIHLQARHCPSSAQTPPLSVVPQDLRVPETSHSSSVNLVKISDKKNLLSVLPAVKVKKEMPLDLRKM